MGTPVEEQVSALRQICPDATLQPLPSGATLVSLPGVSLPPGWSQQTTEIQFLIPAGFPFAQPDCFWADADLRLHSGAPPQNAAVNAVPETGRQMLWFSWHLSHPWNPNRDTLLTWFRVIQNRLREAH